MSLAGKVGIVLNIHWAQPKNPDDASHVEASERMMQFDFGWFANPLFVNGSYPGVMVDNVEKRSIAQGYTESRLPKFTSQERQEINGNQHVRNIEDYFVPLTYILKLVLQYFIRRVCGLCWDKLLHIIPSISIQISSK